MFFGSSALSETDQFSLVFAGAGLRLTTNMILILFVVFYLRRAFESHDVEYLLSRPISKLQFLLAHFVSFVLLALLASILVTLTLLLLPSTASGNSLWLWGISLWLELSLMVTVALFFSMVLSSAVTASMASFAFYVLARLIGDILGIIATEKSAPFMFLMEKIMFVISIFVPRLDLMAQSNWLLYGVSNDTNLAVISGQLIIFIAFILSAAYLDLNKRQF